MFLSYECHSLIQDDVFHIFTLTAPLNDTWEGLSGSVCAFQLTIQVFGFICGNFLYKYFCPSIIGRKNIVFVVCSTYVVLKMIRKTVLICQAKDTFFMLLVPTSWALGLGLAILLWYRYLYYRLRDYLNQSIILIFLVPLLLQCNRSHIGSHHPVLWL